MNFLKIAKYLVDQGADTNETDNDKVKFFLNTTEL